MHNIKDLRKNLDIFKKKFKNRNLNFDADKFNNLDELNRKLINDKEKLEQEKKSLSKSKERSNFLSSKKISGDISILIKKQNESQNNLNQVIFSLPNIALDEVPVGKDENSNKLIKKLTKFKQFTNFKLGLKKKISSYLRNKAWNY